MLSLYNIFLFQAKRFRQVILSSLRANNKSQLYSLPFSHLNNNHTNMKNNFYTKLTQNTNLICLIFLDDISVQNNYLIIFNIDQLKIYIQYKSF